jgi:hypothetical protein
MPIIKKSPEEEGEGAHGRAQEEAIQDRVVLRQSLLRPCHLLPASLPAFVFPSLASTHIHIDSALLFLHQKSNLFAPNPPPISPRPPPIPPPSSPSPRLIPSQRAPPPAPPPPPAHPPARVSPLAPRRPIGSASNVSPPDPSAPAIPQSFRAQIRRNPIGNLDLAAALLANSDALVPHPPQAASEFQTVIRRLHG